MVFENLIAQYPLSKYILFVVSIALGIFLAKVVYYIIGSVIKQLAKNTKTKADDIFVDALEKPVVFLIVIISMQISKGFLQLNSAGLNIADSIITSLYIFNVAWFVSRIIQALLDTYVDPLTKKTESKMDDTLLPLVKKLISFVIYSIAFIFIVQHWGYNVTSLVAGLGIGGIAIAMAAKDVLANFFGGGTILTDKPFKVGDRIRVDKYDGNVKEIGLRSTIIKTFDGTEIIIPNSKIVDSYVENVSRENARRIKVNIGVEYSTSTIKLEKAKEILRDVVIKNKSTDDDSKVHFISFGDFSLNIQLIYWIKNLDKILDAQDEINFEIKRAFEKERIEFAFPSQTIYLKK